MITILGPTASGKTRLAAHLAARLGGEILSGDSRQVYRGMDIGTGKDLADYVVDGRAIPYHLIDIVEAGTRYNLFQYQRDFLRAYNEVTARGAVPILCGGSGLYIEAVLRGYRLDDVPQNPELRQTLEGKTLEELTVILASYGPLHNSTDVDHPRRARRAIEIAEYYRQHPQAQRPFPAIESLTIGVDISREVRRQRISERLRRRVEEGMIPEIERLLQRVAPDDLIYYGLEYKYVTLYVTGQMMKGEMLRQLEIAIHQFAKRQMTWFRGMERRGTKIHWIDGTEPVDRQVQHIVDLYEHG